MQPTKLSSTILASGVISTLAPKRTVTHEYNETFENSSDSQVSSTACASILETMFPTFGNIETFPLIGGSYYIDTYGVSYCGHCWHLTSGSTAATFTTVLTGYRSLLGLNNPDILEYVIVGATEIDRSYCRTSGLWYDSSKYFLHEIIIPLQMLIPSFKLIMSLNTLP
ncbi:hypothetical protein BDQ17DRAFT_1428532 [Cyathus striatus]|nr:hypothetical protein BDQ17DRAFT_1428532 [Cyathus striatus]